MSTFIEVVPDAFATNFQKKSSADKNTKSSGTGTSITGDSRFRHVRRPVRGIEIKEDTYATIQVVTATGQSLALADAAGSSTGQTFKNSNFIIQQVQEQRVEKSQTVITFGEPYIFFFGEQPRMLNVQGVLLNTSDFNWKAEFLENYNMQLRGTRCVQNKARVYLSWDDIIVEGYIMNCSVDEQAIERNWVTFNFQMFLTNYQNISGIGDPEAHLGNKDIDVAIEGIDVSYGAATDGFKSSALTVRQANLAASGASKKGLLGMLRDGQVLSAFEAGTSRIVELQDKVANILDRASDFLYGSNIRVPTGFTGAAAFDEDAQLDLASIDPADIEGNKVHVTGIFGGKKFTISATLGASTSPSTYGPLSLNTDEFIARGSPYPTTNQDEFIDLFKAQRGDDFIAAQNVRNTFKVFGIDTEPPSEIMRLIGKVSFGVIGYVGGKALQSIQSQGARQAINVIPTVLT